MDRRSLSVVACLIALGGVGVYVYERQLIELRAELEEARLREAQAAAAFKRLSEIRRAELKVAREAAQRAGVGWSSVSNDAAAEQARRAAEEAARRAQEEERNAAPALGEDVPVDRKKPAASATSAGLSAESIFAQAQVLERQGKNTEAVRLYIESACKGHDPAAKRLGEIYEKGIDGVPPSYADALVWRNPARLPGEVPLKCKRAGAKAAFEKGRAEAEKARLEAERVVRESGEQRSARSLYDEALEHTAQGRHAEAWLLYHRAASLGNAAAAARLAEIYESGTPYDLERRTQGRDRWAVSRFLSLYGGMSKLSPALQQAHLDAVHRIEAKKWRDAEASFGEGAPASGGPVLEQLFEAGRSLERQGRTEEALKAYAEGVRSGSGKSAQRLFEIHVAGTKGIPADADEARKWWHAARALDEPVPPALTQDAYRPGPRFYREPYRIGEPLPPGNLEHKRRQ
jgi:hypothetical protein